MEDNVDDPDIAESGNQNVTDTVEPIEPLSLATTSKANVNCIPREKPATTTKLNKPYVKPI